MSFILDALKKSEAERQRQVSPGLVESGAARPRARLPRWAIAIGALLAVNLLVLLVVLARGWLAAPLPPTAQLPTARARGADAAPVRPAPAASDHFSPLDSAPVYAPEIPVTPSATAAAPAQQAVVPRPLDAGSTGAHPLHRRDPAPPDEDSKSRDEEVLPTINEISLPGPRNLCPRWIWTCTCSRPRRPTDLSISTCASITKEQRCRRVPTAPNGSGATA